MKVRVISYYEIEEKFKQVLTELSSSPLDEKTVVEAGGDCYFFLICVSAK